MIVYRYVCLMRPPAPGAIPSNGLREAHQKEGVAPSGHKALGYCDYMRPLDELETDSYDLEYLLSFDAEDT